MGRFSPRSRISAFFIFFFLPLACPAQLPMDALAIASAMPAKEHLVANLWVDMPLSQILRDISMQAKVAVSMDPTVKDSLISMEAEGMTVDECLEKLASGQGLVIQKISDTFFIVGSGQPGSPTFDQMAETKMVSLKYVNAEHLLGMVPHDLQPYLSRGKRTTDVFIYAPPKKMGQIMGVVGQIDIPRQQVVLEALVVEIDKTNGSEFSMNWLYQGAHSAVGLSNESEIFTGFARHTTIPESAFRSFMVTLNMLVSEGKASIRSRPRVATLNGEQATIDMSLEEYFTIITDVSGTFLRTELQVVKSGVLLKMTPQVGDKGDITVDVATEVSDVAAQPSKMNRQSANASGDLPVIRRRKAETQILVKDGDAIVIGGLIESQERKEVRRVPILGSIPVLGIPFRKTIKSSAEKEVVIFITPRLMPLGAPPETLDHKFVDLEKERLDMRPKLADGLPKNQGKGRE